MEVKIYYKPMKIYTFYEFEEEEFTRLECDFNAYIESKSKEPAGGSYLCREFDFQGKLSNEKKILLRFSDVVIH